MDLVHAKKSANRFHKATVALASIAMGLEEKRVVDDKYSLPLVVQENGKIFVLNMGTPHQDDDFITPYIVNGAFSLELHLKLLNFLETNKWSKEHRLDTLFRNLSEKRKTAIEDIVGKRLQESPFLKQALTKLEQNGVRINWTASELLRRSSDAYVAWRYAFEAIPGCFAGYSELQSAILIQIQELEHENG